MMLGRWLLISVLFAGLANAQDEAFVDSDAVSDAESMQEQRRLLRDAATQVVDGREAALLANMLSLPWAQMQTQTQAQDRAVIAALRARAAAAQTSDPLLLRLAMSRDLSRSSAPEQVDAMLAQLEALDPGNAINSLTAMIGAPKDYADPIYDQRLQEMAAATHYASDYLPILRAGYAALARAYGLAAVPSEADAEARAAEIYQVGVAAAGASAAYAMPAYQHLFRACDISLFPARAVTCRRIGERMFDDTETLMDRLIAIALLERTTSDDADRVHVQALRRESDWQMGAYSELMLQSMGTETMLADQAKHIRALLRSGELVAMRDLLATHGVPLTPPDDWQSKRNRAQ